MDYKLGLNIGITSVGWGMIECSTNNIINSGVRLFPEADPENNQNRRTARAKRRLIRRKQHRLLRLKRLMKESNIINSLDYDFSAPAEKVFLCRKKGLTELLTDSELAIALHHLIKKRGAEDYDLTDTSDDDDGTKAILAKNEVKLGEDKYVCEVQLETLKNNGKVLGKENVFKTKDLKREALKILNTQKKLGNKKVTDKFIEKCIDILEKKRAYWEGPGQESPFSWTNQKEWLQGLMGKCTYFPEEIRMVKHSHSAELFNLLNDLNNLKIARDYAGEKLTDEEKQGLINIFKTQKTVTLKKIAKFLGVEPEAITGYRIDKAEKALFTPLETYIAINKVFETDDRDLIDSIAEICTFYQEAPDRKVNLSELLKKYNLNEETLNALAKNKFTGTHAFSKKLLNILIPEMMKTTKNSMQVITELGLVPYKMNFKGQSKIDKKYVDEWIINPVVKKAVGQCINVVNEILRVYGTPKEVIIECCKEYSSKEETKKRKKIQATREKENNYIRSLLGALKLEKRYYQYVKFWKEQNEKCLLTGEHIPLEDLVNNISRYEIAHIIPMSISFDNSNANKFLVKRSANIKRGTKAPIGYFTQFNTERTFEEFEAQVKELKISKTKKELLLYKGNLSKNYDEFISRNLNDTRYVVKEVKNLLDRFFKDNEYKVKVKGINNSFVTYIRNLWELPRLTYKSYDHYAEDSLILLVGHSILETLKWYKSYEEDNGEKSFYYIRTGEILDDESFKKIFNFSYRKQIVDYAEYKYSHFVDKKTNRKLFNETTYSLRTFKIDNKEKEFTVSVLKDIYVKDNFALAKIFDEKQMETLIIYNSDIRTYNKFEKAYEDYKESAKAEKVNPFYLYYQDNGYIKQGEKDNGTSVKSLKIMNKGINTYFDNSKKYKNPRGKIVFTKQSTFRMDVYSNGEEYKIACVRYPMLRTMKDRVVIDENIYDELLKARNITGDYKFVCSLHDGDIFEIVTPAISGVYKFRGVPDELKSKISIDYIEKSNSQYIKAIIELNARLKKDMETKVANAVNELLDTSYTEKEAKEFVLNYPLSSNQKVISIGKASCIRKKSTDILGNIFNSQEKFKKTFKK